MSAATNDRNTPSRAGMYQALGLAAAALIFAGTLVCYDTSGDLVPAANTSGYVFAGVSRDQYDNSDGAAGDVTGEYSTRGQFKFASSGLAATDVGARLYVSDDQTVTKTAGNVYVGRLVEYISATECWVEIEPCSAEATDTATLTAHLNGGASKHDATEVDYERVDGSKKNIQSGSDTVEAALTDLDDATGLLSGLTTTAKTSAVAAINEVDADISGHLDGGASKHDATEVDYERVDGSKKNIQSGSDTVEAALTDLDDATGLLSGLTTTVKTSAVAAINEVDADLTALRRGTAVINNGTNNVIVSVGAPYDTKPAFASLMEADGAIHILHAVWNGSGDLTITLSANTTGDRTVGWFVDGR